MKHTTKANLQRALKILNSSTLRMIAVEIGQVEVRRGVATSAVTVTQLTDFLHQHPPLARRAATFLRGATRDPKYLPVIEAVEGLRGVGPLTVGGWTITPHGERRLTLRCGERPTLHVEYSTDPRVGLIVMDRENATRASQLEAVTLPRAVAAELADLILPPPPSPQPQDRSAPHRQVGQ